MDSYHDLGGDYFTRRTKPQRITKRLVAQLRHHSETASAGDTTSSPISSARGWLPGDEK